jgi:signal transduction histidine kinase
MVMNSQEPSPSSPDSQKEPGVGSDDFAHEIEIETPPELTPMQQVVTELHSVINLVSVLYGCLELLEAESVAGLAEARHRVRKLSQDIHSAAEKGEVIPLDPDLPALLVSQIESAISQVEEVSNQELFDELQETISAILEVFDRRLQELNDRLAKPRAWVAFSVEQLTSSIQQVLDAIEKNAHGHYRIVKNIAEQTPHDYRVDINISSEPGKKFLMPAVLQDVFRDLIANARKYTDPGGRISAGLFSSSDGVRLVVEDTGLGIPKEELEHVAQFGYRASNVKDRRTHGGGFGLTKALWVTKQFGGRMWIRSQEGHGTRITLFIPKDGHEDPPSS